SDSDFNLARRWEDPSEMPLSVIARYLHVADQWDFHAAAWTFAVDRSRPEKTDWRPTVRLPWIKFGQLLLSFNLHPTAPPADFLCQTRAVFGYVFEKNFVEQHSNGIEVAGKGVRTDTQSLQRY